LPQSIVGLSFLCGNLENILKTDSQHWEMYLVGSVVVVLAAILTLHTISFIRLSQVQNSSNVE
jgi:hypothetical protein